MKEGTFFNWLVFGILQWIVRPKMPSSIPPVVEGIVVGVFLIGIVFSLLLSFLSPWWLCITIPTAVLLLLHGIWRDFIKEGE